MTHAITRIDVAVPPEKRPKCLLCDAPLKPYLRDAWVKVLAGEAINESELLERAERKIREFLNPRPISSLYFVRYDAAALVMQAQANSFRVIVWVNEDYDGEQCIADRLAPCFCRQRCAIEFARLAAEDGFRLRR